MEYGLLGEHLGHSFSKEIHEMIGRYSYEIKELKPEELAGFVKAKKYKGLNVTIPYKEKVIPMLDEVDEAAMKIGAVNTIVNKDGKLFGYNTDFYGMKALIEKLGVEVKGKKALILGTGGTSKTANAVLESMGTSQIIKVSRRSTDETVSYDEALMLHNDANIIINTTPVGMYPNMNAKPIDVAPFTMLEGLVDAIYNPLRSNLVLEAQSYDIKACGGLYMLVMQAIKAAEFFTGEPVEESVGNAIFAKMTHEKESIVLTGMPGAGKSTVGKILARQLSIPFIDTDAEIVKREKREITEIFAKEGEEYFRMVESEVIRDMAWTVPAVIATGGGAILKDENVEALKRNAMMVFLNREPANITPTDDRPLADSVSKVVNLYHKRLPIYKKTADIALDVVRTPEYMAEEILKRR